MSIAVKKPKPVRRAIPLTKVEKRRWTKFVWRCWSKKQSVDGFAFSGKLAENGETYGHIPSCPISSTNLKPMQGQNDLCRIEKTEDRAAVVAYLRTLAIPPSPLPSAAEIAARSELSQKPETRRKSAE